MAEATLTGAQRAAIFLLGVGEEAAAAIMRHKRFRGGMELGAGGAVIEDAPRWTAGIERVQDDIAIGLVEGLDKGAGEIKNDRALSP